MTYPTALPTWIDGVPLSATDLNIVSANQNYLHDLASSINMPFRQMGTGDIRRIVHRYNWLHWVVLATAGSTLYINGIAGPTASATVGTVDLHPGGTNPYGLTVGKPYTVEWRSSTAECTSLYETPESTDVPVLPTTSPTFVAGQMVTASQLNALTTNLDYLKQARIDRPNRPFLQEQLPCALVGTRIYRFINRNRYLYIQTRSEANGATPSFEVKVEMLTSPGGVVYTDSYVMSSTNDRITQLTLDLWQGTANDNYYNYAPLSAVPRLMSYGETYRVKITGDASGATAPRLRVQFVVEIDRIHLY